MPNSGNETERTLSTQPQRRFWEVSPLWSTPTSRTTKSTGRQLNSSHPSTHDIPDASERPSRSSSTTLLHGTYVLHQWYLATPTTERRIFYIQSPQPNPDWGISYILSQPPSLPLCLLPTDSVQWAHTPLPPPPIPPPTPRIPVPPVSRLHASTHSSSSIQSSRDPPALSLRSSISQSPAFSWWWSEHTDRNVEL